jgi:DNA replication protein DnaC
MDAETQQHIDQQRAAAAKRGGNWPKRFDDKTLPELEARAEEVEPASYWARSERLAEDRRMAKTRATLDRLVPVRTHSAVDVQVWDPVEGPDGMLDAIERKDPYTGPLFRTETQCSVCRETLVLESLEEPTVKSRAFALGYYRRLPRQFACDECIALAEIEEKRRGGESERRQRVAESELPDYMQGFAWEEMIPGGGRREVVSVVREWAQPSRPNPAQICLWGAKGAGKTRLAATAAWERLQRHHVRWVSLPVLIARLGASFSDTGRAEAIKVLTGTGPLILDDVARDDIKVSDWAKVQIFTAIDARVQSGSPLLITTNIAPDRLEPILGGSTMSRIAGMKVLELPGRDNRIALPGVDPKAEAEAARHGLRDPEGDR